ncbi:MAG: uroporphyrinogen methyltransferase / synthase [Blastocatellia bacterium]|jgi:uroporphyrin-III C-methyltransferase|nr:uroporphyrinogen methyltransferase / synthase [Blastocatellia bacterium]
MRKVNRGVLVVGHGSRRHEANEDVREATRRIGERGRFVLIEVAFLEIEHPNISEGFARLVEQGASEITVHPYFLSPGRHTRGDIPLEVHEAASHYAGVCYRITEPLSAHPLVIEASVQRIFTAIEREQDEKNAAHYRARGGTVYLVGAGPGDPGLLTIKARDLLASCDVVIYDYLVNPEMLSSVRAGADHIYVGKVGGGQHAPQDEINNLLVTHAQNGQRVVRLKGGDPFLFGRGAEEAEILRKAGVAFEVVPGISAALAVPAYAGIPLTKRGLSSSVAVLTGARGGEGAPENSALANLASVDTLVVLMGAAHLRQIAKDLVAAGRSAQTPAAIIRWGTYEGQQTVTGTLETIAVEAERVGMKAPAVIIVGEVVRLREHLNWFEQSLESIKDEELESVFAMA